MDLREFIPSDKCGSIFGAIMSDNPILTKQCTPGVYSNEYMGITYSPLFQIHRIEFRGRVNIRFDYKIKSTYQEVILHLYNLDLEFDTRMKDFSSFYSDPIYIMIKFVAVLGDYKYIYIDIDNFLYTLYQTWRGTYMDTQNTKMSDAKTITLTNLVYYSPDWEATILGNLRNGLYDYPLPYSNMKRAT